MLRNAALERCQTPERLFCTLVAWTGSIRPANHHRVSIHQQERRRGGQFLSLSGNSSYRRPEERVDLVRCACEHEPTFHLLQYRIVLHPRARARETRRTHGRHGRGCWCRCSETRAIQRWKKSRGCYNARQPVDCKSRRRARGVVRKTFQTILDNDDKMRRAPAASIIAAAAARRAGAIDAVGGILCDTRDGALVNDQ